MSSKLVRSNLTMRTMQLNAWVADNLYYNVITLNHSILFSYQLLRFCTTEYLVSITVNGMRGWPIILHPLICLFYLLQLNIISLISHKITLALCLLLAFCKNGILFLPEKKLVWPKPEQLDRFHHIFENFGREISPLNQLTTYK